MSATVTPATPNGRVVTLTSIDADWEFTDDADYKAFLGERDLVIYDIWFFPGAVADKLIINDTTVAGAEWKLESISGEHVRLEIGGKKMYPVIDQSECTLSAGAFVTIYYGRV